MESGVYQITNTKSQRIYIGSSLNVRTRIRAHKVSLRNGTHHSYLLQRAFDKYGESCFSFEQIVICREQDRLEYEQAIIDGLSPFYNICKQVGSTKGLNIRPEGRANMRAAWKRRGGMTDAQAKHLSEISAANRGVKKSPMSGEQKEKLSVLMTGKKQSKETILKKSLAMTGRKMTPETKQKISAAMTGKKRQPFSDEWRAKIGLAGIGRVMSPETRKKLADSKRGKTLSDEIKNKRLNDMRQKKAANQ